jgi:hypothetical protein
MAVFLAGGLAFAFALAPMGPVLLGDKALHFMAFALIGWLAVRAGWNAFAVASGLCIFASAIEIAQAAWAPERSASVLDAAASMLGGWLGVGISRLKSWRAIAVGACACGVIGVSLDLAVSAARPAVTRALIAGAWRSATATLEPQVPWVGAPARVVARLEIKGQEIFIGDSSTRRALAMTPGLWPGRRPGDIGTTIVLGHRNAQFRILDTLALGDTIAVETVEGQRIVYRITSREVVLWNESGLSPETHNEVLAFVTCWPIGESEPTSWRLVIRAEPLGGSEELHASSLSIRSSSVVR